MNYRRIINLYKKNDFNQLNELAFQFACDGTIINLDGYNVFFNYSRKEEHIIKANDDFELQAYKFFAKLVKENGYSLAKLNYALQRNSRAFKASKYSRNQ